jgi:putative (di)nucleoside polyphosphate hydrolase
MVGSLSNNLPYRLGVGIMVLNSYKEVFVARRVDFPDGWQMPQGGIDEGESPLQAALRELKEEIGTANVHLLAESNKWFSYDFPPSIIEHLRNNKYRGQQQKWFVMEFLGHEKEINLNTQQPEFLEWKWVPFFELPNLVVSFKKDVYQQLIKEFSFLIS